MGVCWVGDCEGWECCVIRGVGLLICIWVDLCKLRSGGIGVCLGW